MYLAVMLMALYVCGINSCIFVQFLIKKLLFGKSLQYAKHCIAVYSVRWQIIQIDVFQWGYLKIYEVVAFNWREL